MKTILVPSLLALVLFASCSPRPIVRMQAVEDQPSEWNYGKQIVIDRSGDYEARVFFDTYTKKHLVFDVEIVNLGEDTVLVSPEAFYLEANTGATIHRRNALNPEVEILNNEINESRREANAKTAALIAGTVAVAGVVAIAASDAGDGSADNDGAVPFTYIDVSPVVPLPVASVLPPDLSFWEEMSLRKTTLPPGFKVMGKVVFERMDEARSFTLQMPVGPTTLAVGFVQQIIRP